MSVRWINRRGCELMGYPEEALLGQDWFDKLVPETQRLEAKNYFMQLARQESQSQAYYEVALLRGTGRTAMSAWHITLLRETDGSVSALLCAGEDITERKQTENFLRKNLLRYGRFFEDSPISIWETDFSEVKNRLQPLYLSEDSNLSAFLDAHPETLLECLCLLRVIDVNHQSLKLFCARDKEEFLHYLHNLFLPESMKSFKEIVLAAMSGKPAYECEMTLQAFSGEQLHTALRMSFLPDANGSGIRALVSLLDISTLKRMEETLRANYIRYSRFFEDSPIAMWEVEHTALVRHLEQLRASGISDWRAYFAAHPSAIFECLPLINFTDLNKAAMTLFEARDKQQLLLNWPKLLLEESLPALKDMLIAFFEGNQNFQSELHCQSLAGKRIHAALSFCALCDSDQTQHLSLLTAVDITARKLVEEALRVSEEKHRLVIDNVSIGVAVLNPSMEVLTLNRALRRWFPCIPVEAQPLCYRVFNDPPGERPCAYCPVTLTLQDGAVHEAVTRTPREGKTFHYRIVSTPVKNPAGEIISVIETVEDFTHRQQTEDALQHAHNRIERLFSAMPSVLISVDELDQIEHWNPAAEKTFGIAIQNTVGRHFSTCGIQWDWKTFNDRLKRISPSQSFNRIEALRYQRPDGKEGFLDLVITPFHGDNEDGFEMLLLGTDITERKVLQDQLLQAQKLESIGQLASGIAHEINTPTQYVGDNLRFFKEAYTDLAALLSEYHRLLLACSHGTVSPALLQAVGQAETKADISYLAEELPKAISQSLEGIERVTTIVHAMKEFAHPDSAGKTPVNLNHAIASTLTVARNEWKYVCDLETSFDPALPLVPCLPGQFNQVILNIIVNAAHAISDVVEGGKKGKGKITVTTKQAGDFAEISISDTGTGIPESILPRIFDPFFTTKKVGRGTGQGLAISHNVIVEKHGGAIDVETRIGEGTTFILRLPLNSPIREEDLERSRS